ncbi:MAG: TolC family protein [Negativicutes bacterium]|jgi:outer membrane protein TolC
MKRLSLLLIFVLVGMNGLAAADDNVSLDSLTIFALKNSPELTAANAAVISAQQVAPQANSLPDPMVGINYQSDQLQPNLSGELSWLMLSASQEITLPGKLSLRRQIAEANVEKSKFELRAVQSELVGKIAEQYIELCLLDKKIQIITGRIALADDLVTAATIRYKTGSAEQQDVLLAQKASYELQLEREQLKRDEQTGSAQLLATSGKTDNDGTLRVQIPEQGVMLPANTELIKTVLQQSAALAALKQQWDVRVLETKLAEEERFPDYTVSAGISVAGGMPGMWNAGMQLSVPINLANKQERAVAQAQAGAVIAQAQYSTRKLALVSEVKADYAAYLAAKRTLSIYNDQLLALGKRTYAASLAAYSTGRNTIGNVLEQLNTALDYETGYWEQYAAVLKNQAQLQALANSNIDRYLEKERGNHD